ncbi:DUF1697 domain-containing protein [Advenella mimigardefordensis]|uniref:DUF1697 domain-containing protein n=1 Tax=Advenella mimigardefordensis (strain DSM 17166 / LMG 22922 / DPN7) TaxID=1247726 RepID=W0PJ02_ADVMD|nr:DUF1697 domain-containing protein [Advenella mimigardefordensis]AHG65545.1 hypothetical protein MIM_c34850 [Advenella mimigardefordensis DPN7]
MHPYVALLRAVNVGGTGKLPMSELKAMCIAQGFVAVQTYIASGNVVFSSELPKAKVKAALEKQLHAYAGKAVTVIVRTAQEMSDLLNANPFTQHPQNRTLVIFLDEAPPADAISNARDLKDEQISLGKREIYVAYGDDMGRSKLKIPAAANGTARNMNTVVKLASMLADKDE